MLEAPDRRTLCYTKSLVMLRACAVIKCWGGGW